MDEPKLRKKRQATNKKKDKGTQVYSQKSIRIKQQIVSSSKDPK